MAIFAIADLHLSFQANKPMNVFGEKWNGYEEKLKENWIKMVGSDDLVLLPGDFSWATYMQDTIKDFEFINKLPGKKLLLKGNHDFWWSTVTSMDEFLKKNNFENISFLFNSAIEFDDKIIVGTRGWSLNENSENMDKMLNRESARLENSIQAGIKQFGNEKEIICIMHYPPITNTMVQNHETSKYIQIMQKYNIKKCLYGHLHGNSHQDAVEGIINGIELKLVSSDYLEFVPYKIN